MNDYHYEPKPKRDVRTALGGKRRIDRCANVTCNNRANEGGFTTVHLGEAQHRSVVIVLCVPCSGAF